MATDEAVQLDLFSGVVRRRRLAEDALDEFRLDDAVREFTLYLETYPRDDDARGRLVAATELAERLARMRAETADDFRALLALGEYVARDDLKKAWHRRVARDAEARFREGCRIDGMPAGLHWLDGGDAVQAAQSLRATLDATPHTSPDRARILAYLGDAFDEGKDAGRAGAHYLSAFLVDPAAVDTTRMANKGILHLVCRDRMPNDIDGDWRDWIAPVGVVERFFELPKRNFWGLEKLPGDPDLHVAGRPGLEFFRLLIGDRDASSADQRRVIRTRMKELCPSLFLEHLNSSAPT